MESTTPEQTKEKVKRLLDPRIFVDRVEVRKTANPQAAVIIGFDSESVRGATDDAALTVAKTLASGYGYPTGYIFESLRGQGLVYVAEGDPLYGRDESHPGAYLVLAGCDPRNVNKVVDVILLNMARLQGSARDIQPQWFERSKQLIITTDALENETAAAQAQTAAVDELFGLGYDYHARFAERINKVKLSEVQEIGRKRLSHCVVTINTNAPDAVTIKAGTRKYSAFPPVDLAPRGTQHDVTH